MQTQLQTAQHVHTQDDHFLPSSPSLVTDLALITHCWSQLQPVVTTGELLRSRPWSHSYLTLQAGAECGVVTGGMVPVSQQLSCHAHCCTHLTLSCLLIHIHDQTQTCINSHWTVTDIIEKIITFQQDDLQIILLYTYHDLPGVEYKTVKGCKFAGCSSKSDFILFSLCSLLTMMIDMLETILRIITTWPHKTQKIFSFHLSTYHLMTYNTVSIFDIIICGGWNKITMQAVYIVHKVWILRELIAEDHSNTCSDYKGRM